MLRANRKLTFPTRVARASISTMSEKKEMIPRELNEEQLTAAYYLGLGLSITDAAKKAEVSRKAVSVWMNHHDIFKAEVEKWRSMQASDLTAALVASQLQVVGLTDLAVKVMKADLEERDEEDRPT